MNFKKLITQSTLIVAVSMAIAVNPTNASAERHNGGHNPSKAKITHSKSHSRGGHRKHNNRRIHRNHNHRRSYSRPRYIVRHNHNGGRHHSHSHYPHWSYSINYQVDDFLSFGFHSH